MTFDLANAASGVVFNFQRFSLNDGPGIRTVVFLKGCPLHCPWCSNPESQQTQPEPFYLSNRCMHCGACAAVCPEHAIRIDSAGHRKIERSRCTGCGKCAEVCACDAMRIIGKVQSVRSVVDQILKDATCYQLSGGGVTLSGGEPLMQADFSIEILRSCRDHNIHTAVETTGFVSADIMRAVLPHVDCFLFDLKHLDPQKHRTAVGVDNVQILQNLQFLMDHQANVIARLPMIPEFNTDNAYLLKLKSFLERTGFAEAHILPYHIYGESKYHSLGRTYQMPSNPMCEADIKQIREVLQSDHYQLKIHG